MAYIKQNFTNFGEPLTAEQLIKMEDAIIDIEESIDSGYRLVGTTPIITNSDFYSIKLSAEEPTNYTVSSPTVWNFETVSETPKLVKCTYTREEDRHVITSQSTSVDKWHNSYMEIVVDNLVAGQEYKILSPISKKFLTASDNGEINLCSFGVLNAAYQNLVGSTDLASDNGGTWHKFTPTENTVKIRVYPSFARDEEPFTDVTGIFENFVVKLANSNDKIESITIINGNTAETPVISNIPKGYLVSSDIEAKVYGSSIVQADGDSSTYTGPLSGKEIVVLGDSIMGMYRGKESVCWYIEQTTGATVYNGGCGGCRMSTSHPSMSFTGWSLPYLTDSIVTGDFSVQENTTPGVDYFNDVTATLKSIDFSKVDIIIIHYGTNDYNLKAELDNKDNPYDTVTCCGGLRYSVEKLFEAYPQLTIFVSLPAYRLVNAPDGNGKIPVEDDINVYGQTYEEYREGIRKAAEAYNLKIIDSYKNLGVNKFNHAAFIGDGTHHNKWGRKRLGEFIASELF